MWLLVLFIVVPLIEIALFIQVGGWLTLWPTLAIVVATAVVGTWLVRQQGARVMRDMQRAMEQFDDPLAPLAHGAMILFAGALLLTPGFLTDAVGFALLVPALRKVLLRWIARNQLHVRAFGAASGGRPGASGRADGAGPRDAPRHRGAGRREDVIDAEFQDLAEPVDEADRQPGDSKGGRRSPWR